jgi:hypothetical protein
MTKVSGKNPYRPGVGVRPLYRVSRAVGFEAASPTVVQDVADAQDTPSIAETPLPSVGLGAV